LEAVMLDEGLLEWMQASAGPEALYGHNRPLLILNSEGEAGIDSLIVN
jgi:hypothetical protein